MSRKFKFSVKNVTSGLQSFSELLAGNKTQHHSRISRLVPRSISLRKPDCNYFKQEYVQKNAIDFTKISTLTQPPGKSALQHISSEIPFQGKRLDTLNFSSVRSPTHGFPWGSTYRFYYDVPKPQCPPPAPKPCSGDGKGSEHRGSSGCPPLKDTMPKSNPCGNPCGNRTMAPKQSPCTRKMCTFTVPLNIYRFYCAGSKRPSRCPPKGGGGAGKGTGKGPICPPQKKVPDCSGGRKGGGAKKGPICPPQKKVPDCSGGGRKGGGAKKGPVCPSQKKVPDCSGGAKKGGKGRPRCPPRGKAGGGAKSRCPPKGKKGGGGRSKCTPKKSGGGARPKCAPKKSRSKCGSKSQGPKKCTPKKSSSKSSCRKGSSGGDSAKPNRCASKKSGGGSGSSAGKCKPKIQRAPSCGGKKKPGRAGSQCQRKGPPKKPKC